MGWEGWQEGRDLNKRVGGRLRQSMRKGGEIEGEGGRWRERGEGERGGGGRWSQRMGEMKRKRERGVCRGGGGHKWREK